ncbi:SPOR domain-containing protein [Pacificoceanicola onchidii]|uniref:SPOR domain-containing protein n=1 Tax=Pacificoceanicola onchidii TaxID=2562685 RepID=UPI0010A5E48B|nr:SPOR domain-containing protein [Pacificoceanicola onchidii]
MTLKSLTIIALFTAGLGMVSQPAAAQGLDAVPVNFPPASFNGRQFVDNKGCVFVRAGFDGNVTWVPRVTRQRKQICGQTPTFGGGGGASAPVTATAPAPAPAPTARPVQITADPQPAPVRSGVTLAQPSGTIRVLPGGSGTLTPAAPTTTARTAPVVRRAPASKPPAAQPPRVVRRVPAPAPTQPRATVRAAPPATGAGPCINGSRTRVVDGRSYVSACGPQKAPQVTSVRRGWKDSKATAPAITPQTRIVPRKVYERQQQVLVSAVPEGYRPAWSDDRLNPYRAYQTVEGYRDTQQVWTNRVPRKLTSSVRVHRKKEPTIAYVGNTKQYPTPIISTSGSAHAVKTPVISTRSAPKASGARYVEIGAFTTKAKAQAAAARLSAAGLPVRYGTLKRGGQTLRRVMVGPYASAAALDAGLRTTRSVGYTQAYIR